MADSITLHRKEYGTYPEVAFSAPGVVNLLGEHTDYNEGYVLQMALDRRVEVAISRRKDNSLRFFTGNFNERKRTTVANIKYKREDRWANYLKGVLFEIGKRKMGFKGLNFTIFGDIPPEIGLAASAAMCTAAAYGMKKLFGYPFADKECVEIASSAERDFFGIEATLVDPMTSALAKGGRAMFIDMRQLEYSYVPLRLKDAKILVTVSNVPKVAAGKEFSLRKEECRKCVEYLNRKKPGKTLRDYSPEDLKGSMGLVPENTRRVCMHVAEENERVLEGREAVERGDLSGFGKLLSKSHESLRDNFEVSCPEIDWLVKRAGEIEDVLGARLTGSGFGGCTVTLIRERGLDAYYERLDEYERIFGFHPETFFCEAAAGVREVAVSGK
jgi:galactokinase